MRLILIVGVLMLIGVASAEREYTQVNGFNVSFDLNQTHDTAVDTGDGINGSVAIRTFDGLMTCRLFQYPKPYSLNSTWVQEDLIASVANGAPAERIEINKTQGIFTILMSSDTGEPVYRAFYYPGIQDGKASAFVSFTSTLPFYTTADLLRTIVVAV